MLEEIILLNKAMINWLDMSGPIMKITIVFVAVIKSSYLVIFAKNS